MDIREIIERLGLQPHPAEGGLFAETYRGNEVIEIDALPERYGRAKAFSSAIYYLLTPGVFSAMHSLLSDEVYHFYLGDTVEMLNLFPDGSHKVLSLGSDILNGELPQLVVPQRVWQGSRLKEGGRYALLGTTVAPAFDYEDFELGRRSELVCRYPECAQLIEALTRS